jgi:hypothetical protein
MNTSNTPNNAAPLWGILSIVLAPVGLLIVMYFAFTDGWGFARWTIIFAQYLTLSLLGSGMAAGLAGVIRREQPKWPSVIGLVMTICIIGLIVFFFHSLDD